MTEHAERELLNAYLDEALNAGQKGRMESHLLSCGECRAELGKLEAVKSAARSLEKRAMPALLAARIEALAAEKLAAGPRRELLALPRLWIPAAAFAALFLLLGVWFFRQSAPEETIPIETILAAHDRYLSEGMLPEADLAGGAFSGKLAAYEEPAE